MDLPLYATEHRNAAKSDLGSATYHLFTEAVVLKQVMRKSGQDPFQETFSKLLLQLRVTAADWEHLMNQTPRQVQNLTLFSHVVYLHATTEAVVEHNVARLHACGQPAATIKAIHSGPNAAKASPDDASGLDPVVCLAHGARVMLIAICGLTWDWSIGLWEQYQPSAMTMEELLLTCK